MVGRSLFGTALATLVGIVLLTSCEMEQPGVESAAAAPAEDVEPLGPVELFFVAETGAMINLDELDEKQRAQIDDLRRTLVTEAGLPGTVARLAFPEPAESEHGKLLWKRVVYHVNLPKKRAFFDVSVRREMAQGQQTERRWVVAVVGGKAGEELMLTQMAQPKPNPRDPNQPFIYKLGAEGSAIHLIAYYENGVLIQDPALYESTKESCIDIFMVAEPLPTAVLGYDSAVDGPSDTTGTCFGRCQHPGIFATN